MDLLNYLVIRPLLDVELTDVLIRRMEGEECIGIVVGLIYALCCHSWLRLDFNHHPRSYRKLKYRGLGIIQIARVFRGGGGGGGN